LQGERGLLFYQAEKMKRNEQEDIRSIIFFLHIPFFFRKFAAFAFTDHYRFRSKFSH